MPGPIRSAWRTEKTIGGCSSTNPSGVMNPFWWAIRPLMKIGRPWNRGKTCPSTTMIAVGSETIPSPTPMTCLVAISERPLSRNRDPKRRPCLLLPKPPVPRVLTTLPQPRRDRNCEHQVVVIPLSPCLLGVLFGEHDLRPEGLELPFQEGRVGKLPGDSEPSGLEEDGDGRDELALGHPALLPVAAHRIAAGDRDAVDASGDLGLGNHVDDRLTHSGRIDRDQGLDLLIRKAGDDRSQVLDQGAVALLPVSLQVADFVDPLRDLLLGLSEDGEGRVLAGLAEIYSDGEAHAPPQFRDGSSASSSSSSGNSGFTWSVNALSMSSGRNTRSVSGPWRR